MLDNTPYQLDDLAFTARVSGPPILGFVTVVVEDGCWLPLELVAFGLIVEATSFEVWSILPGRFFISD